MRTLVLGFIAAITASAASACTSSESPSTALEAARARFAATPRLIYSFTWKRSCSCEDSITRAARVNVANDTVTAAVYLDDQQPLGANALASIDTVNDVFAVIQHAIDDDAAVIEVTYDPVAGYPSSVFVERAPVGTDGEYDVRLSELAAVPTQQTD